MIEGQGLFQLAARSQTAARYHALPRPKAQPAVHLTPAMQRDSKMQAFWQGAARKAAESVTISDDTAPVLAGADAGAYTGTAAGESQGDSAGAEVTTLDVTVSTLAIQDTTLGGSANLLV